jgi:hypothetical protein
MPMVQSFERQGEIPIIYNLALIVIIAGTCVGHWYDPAPYPLAPVSTVALMTPLANLADQERCERRAAAFFKEHEWGVYRPQNGFVNHYNPLLAKCFIEVSWMGEPTPGYEPVAWSEVYDVFEDVMYAEMLGSVFRPGLCRVRTQKAERVRCHSKEEYDMLVARYLMDESAYPNVL